MMETDEPERRNVKRDGLIQTAFNIFDSARKGSPITDEDGQPVLCDGEPIFAPDLASANRALEIIAELSGLMIERREVVTLPRTEAELRAQLERLNTEIAKRRRVSNCGRSVVDMTAKQPD